MAKSVNGIHGSVNKIADACTKLAGVDSELIASDAKAVEYLDRAIQAAETPPAIARRMPGRFLRPVRLPT